jgi:uncharacterized XkdX family phage protein
MDWFEPIRRYYLGGLYQDYNLPVFVRAGYITQTQADNMTAEKAAESGAG